MSRSAYRFLPQKYLQTLAIYCGVTCIATWGTACRNHRDRRPGIEPAARLVSVASIRWDRVTEQQEVRQVLRTNGITVDFWGSKMYSVLVPREQGQHAFAILQTNHLIKEKKVLLSEPTEVQSAHVP